MKKKFWLVAILAAALLLLLGAAALASGSTCEHSWTINGDGTHTCRNCGATGACSDGKATCVRPAICEVCGVDYGSYDSNAHEYEWQSDGFAHKEVCKLCSQIRNPAACRGGVATCTQKAVCSFCGREYGDLKPHNFTTLASNQLASAATCTEAAKYYVQCTNCVAVSDTVTVAVGNPLEHEFVWQSNGDGKHNVSCSNTGFN